MKHFVAAFVAALVLSGPALAQSSFSYPNAYGGYTTVTPGQPPVFVAPNAYGGYTTQYQGQPPVFAVPNAYGGYNELSPVPLPLNLFDQ